MRGIPLLLASGSDLDGSTDSGYDYPAGAKVLPLFGGQDKAAVAHLIFYGGDPSTNFNAAPIGSIFIRNDAGNVGVSFKADATTWTPLAT